MAAALRQGRVRERLVGVQIIALLALIALAVIVAILSARDTSEVRAATLHELPATGVLYLDLEATFHDPLPTPLGKITRSSPVPVILHRDRDGVIRAFYQRDPRNGCTLAWQVSARTFVDPCHSSTYRADGTWVRGPSTRDLDQFGVRVNRDGTIWINLRAFRPGAEHL